MNSRLNLILFFVLLVNVVSFFPVALCEEQVFASSRHDDHFNDTLDELPNDYAPFLIPICDGSWITVEPSITCAKLENDTWSANFIGCKLAQTFLVDDDWSDGYSEATYIFEDWIDFDWNDIVMNLQASTYYGVFSNLLITSREAHWKNPVSLEVTASGAWIKIVWNSTDYPSVQTLTVDEGRTVELILFSEANCDDKAFIKFLIPPIANFSWTPERSSAEQIVVFDAAESFDCDTEIQSYEWNFGDGTSTNTLGTSIIHPFAHPGDYVVELTVTDTDGLTNSILKPIEVSALVGGDAMPIETVAPITWRALNVFLIVTWVAIAAIKKRKKRIKV